MNPVSEFRDLLKQQRELVEYFASMDNFYLDPQRHIRERGARRGWTRRDLFAAKTFELPPSTFKPRRLSTALRLHPSLRKSLIVQAGQKAMDFCNKSASLGGVGQIVLELMTLHSQWMESPICEQEYKLLRSKLDGMLEFVESDPFVKVELKHFIKDASTIFRNAEKGLDYIKKEGRGEYFVRRSWLPEYVKAKFLSLYC